MEFQASFRRLDGLIRRLKQTSPFLDNIDLNGLRFFIRNGEQPFSYAYLPGEPPLSGWG